MKRGDIVIAAGRGAYSGKPRPALLIQADFFNETYSVTVLLLTSEANDLPLLRVGISSSPETGLTSPSWVMIDKIVTIRRTAISKTIGTVDRSTMIEIERRLAVFIGLA